MAFKMFRRASPAEVSPSSDSEKDETKEFGGLHALDVDLHDPDAGLSDEERKVLVSRSYYVVQRPRY